MNLKIFDILRAVAIILVVLSHLDDFFPPFAFIDSFDHHLAFAGLTVFFFISGYLIHRTNSDIDILKFYKKRAIRIYPMYWVAIAVYVLMFGVLGISAQKDSYSFDLASIIVHATGTQAFTSFSMPALWYVGVILICYAVYPILTFKNNSYWIIATATLFYLISGQIHSGLERYFPYFVFGILAKQYIDAKYLNWNVPGERIYKPIARHSYKIYLFHIPAIALIRYLVWTN